MAKLFTVAQKRAPLDLEPPGYHSRDEKPCKPHGYSSSFIVLPEGFEIQKKVPPKSRNQKTCTFGVCGQCLELAVETMEQSKCSH
jgi:hypothetical protein